MQNRIFIKDLYIDHSTSSYTLKHIYMDIQQHVFKWSKYEHEEKQKQFIDIQKLELC